MRIRNQLTVILVLLLLSTTLTVSASVGQPKGRYIVVLEEGVEPRTVAKAHGLAPAHIYNHALKGFSAVGVTHGRLMALERDPRVSYVEKDIILHAISQNLPTGIDRIEVDKNPSAKIDGVDERVDVDIAIIDTGIDVDHPDLNVSGGTHFYTVSSGPPWSRGSRQDSNYDDDNGHGTHVAGTAAALDNGYGVVGVAPGARLWAVKVLDSSGSGYLSDIIAGVDWVTQNSGTIEVTNLSLGGQGTSSAFRRAISNCVNAGVVVVVAAGNEGSDVYGNDGVFGTSDDYIPAAYPEAATISAMADSDGKPGGAGSSTSYGSDDSFATFSNYASDVVWDNPVRSPGAAIDLLLPGVDILSTYLNGGYATGSGTSMASPHGAGLAALYIAEKGRASDASGVSAIRQALIDAGVNQDSVYGLSTLNDSDSNWEKIGWAATGAPSIIIQSPSHGATVQGTITISATASDTDGDVSQVEFYVDDYFIDTDSDGTNGWDASWITTSYSEGDHVITAVATDNEGKTASDTVTVTVDNYSPPSVEITNPVEGSTVSGIIDVNATASDNDGIVSKVEFFLGETSIGIGTEDSGIWSVSLDTESYADGQYIISAVATDDDGESATSSVTVTFENMDEGGMYVWDIQWMETGPHIKTIVTVRYDSDADGIAESTDNPVNGAQVSMTMTREGGTQQSYTGTTGSTGQVEFQWKRAPTGSYTAEITELTHSTYTWNKLLDVDNPDTFIK